MNLHISLSLLLLAPATAAPPSEAVIIERLLLKLHAHGIPMDIPSLLHDDGQKPLSSPSVGNTEDAANSSKQDYLDFRFSQRTGRESAQGQSRAHSFPLITGDGFRMFADVVIDETADDWQSHSWCASIHGRNNEPVIVFVKTDLLSHFFLSGCFDRIQFPMVMISHNSDNEFPMRAQAPYLDDSRIIAWFAQNCAVLHPKLICIPIGLENRMYGPPAITGSHGNTPEVILEHMESFFIQRGLSNALACFNPSTHSTRSDLISMLSRAQTAGQATWVSFGCEQKRSIPDLYKIMLDHAAIICPRGNGLDTHRMWETLYLGRVAIALHSALDPLFKDLPVVLLNSWDELLTAEPQVLAMAEMPVSKGARDKLFLPYWLCLIGKAASREAEFCSKRALLAKLQN